MPSFHLIKHRDRDRIPVSERDADAPVTLEPSEAAQLNLELFQQYETAQDDWALEATECEEFLHNVHLTEDQAEELEKRGQSPLPVNVVWPAVEQAVAMLTTNKPSYRVTAREDSDVKTAKVMSDMLSWVWEQSSGNEKLKTAIYDYMVKGRGVLQAYVDPNGDFGKGEVCIRDVDPLDVFPDPNSKDRLWRDAAHVLVSSVRTREELENLWPDIAPILEHASTEIGGVTAYSTGLVSHDNQQLRGTQTSTYHDQYRIIERYTKVKVTYHDIIELFSDQEKIVIHDQYEDYLAEPAVIASQNGEQMIVTGEDVAQFEEMFQQGQPTQDPRVRIFYQPEQQLPTGEVVPEQQIEIAMLENADLIAMGQIESREYLQTRILLVISVLDIEYWSGYLPIAEYPLVPLNNRHFRTPYPMSDVQFVKPIQKNINKMQAQIIANLSSSTNVKAFVPRGSVDKDLIELEFAKPGAAIIEYDAEFGAPVIAQPVPIPSGAFTQFNTLISLIERELGIYSLMQGDASQAPATHKGTIAIEQFGQRRIRSKLDDIEGALNHLAKITIPLIQTTYTRRKVIRLVEPNNTVRESIANVFSYDSYGDVIDKALDLTSGIYDGVVVTGSTLPSNRFALLDYYIELRREGIIDTQEVLKKTDVVDSEGVMERNNVIQQLSQENETLKEEIQKKDGDLQTREREVYHAKLALEVERGKQEITNTVNRMDMAGQLYEQRQADELKNSQRELTAIKTVAKATTSRPTSTVKKQ